VDWLQAALWGIAGGFVVEGLELQAVLKKRRKWPWHVRGPGVRASRTAYLIAEAIRLLIGGILAAATAASGQVSTPLAALAIGVAAPVLVERLTSLLPLPADGGASEAGGGTTTVKADEHSKMTSSGLPPGGHGSSASLSELAKDIRSDPASERGV